MPTKPIFNAETLTSSIGRLPVAPVRPVISIVVPVNAKGDLENVCRLLQDLAGYQGPHGMEVILVVNNFAGEEEPREIEHYRRIGARVVAIANVRRADRPGEAVCLSARIPGVRSATSEAVVLFDADCRIPNVTALLNWYVEQFQQGAAAAYSHVGYYDCKPLLGVRAKIALHHGARWVKRTFFGIPTTRGSNYGVRRQTMLDLYDRGMLADDLNVGPAAKRLGRVAYSGRRELEVLTSGRMFSGDWLRMIPYFLYRLRYNLRVLPVRTDAEKYTHRERTDPADRYVYKTSGS